MSIHVSVMTAEITGRTLKAALKYCELYRCATVKELYDAVKWRRRPAGVGDSGRRRLEDAMKFEILTNRGLTAAKAAPIEDINALSMAHANDMVEKLKEAK